MSLPVLPKLRRKQQCGDCEMPFAPHICLVAPIARPPRRLQGSFNDLLIVTLHEAYHETRSVAVSRLAGRW